MESQSKTVTLYCEWGDHDWERPSISGRKPRDCPAHKVEAATTRKREISSRYLKRPVKPRVVRTLEEHTEKRRAYEKLRLQKRKQNPEYHEMMRIARKKYKKGNGREKTLADKRRWAKAKYDNFTPEQYAQFQAENDLRQIVRRMS